MAKLHKVVSQCEVSRGNNEYEKIVDWEMCILCRKLSIEPLVCPAISKRKDTGAGYLSLASNLSQLHELQENPLDFDINEIDDGSSIASTLTINKACWHKSCRNKINTTEVKRAAKRKEKESEEVNDSIKSVAKTRRLTKDKSIFESRCFFCDKSGGNLHRASTIEVDTKVRKYATELNDTRLLTKLAAGDMVAIDAMYHTKCIVGFYNCVRRNYSKTNEDQENSKLHAIAFAELVLYIEEFRENKETSTVFPLADLCKMYSSKLEDLGAEQHSRVHAMRLKDKLEAELPDPISFKQKNNILLTFNEDMGEAVLKACEHDDDSEALLLARASRIIRRDIFAHKNRLFNGSFETNCQESSVPSSLKALVLMILDGPQIKTESVDNLSTTAASLAISQLMSFNCVKNRKPTNEESQPVMRHNREHESPVPLYIGLKIHAETRSRTLIDTFFQMGLSISYDRAMSISTDAANSVCYRFEQDGLVCPPKLRKDLFCTAAFDNIDHNPSATTAKDLFHGTAISVVQHITAENYGNGMVMVIMV